MNYKSAGIAERPQCTRKNMQNLLSVLIYMIGSLLKLL